MNIQIFCIREYENNLCKKRKIFTYLLGMFFIISVVRLSSPLFMRSMSSSYSFKSVTLDVPTFLRLLKRLWESNELLTIWFLSGYIMPLWLWKLSPKWGSMLWGTNSTQCGVTDSPTLVYLPSQRGGDCTWWLFVGKTVVIICDGDIGSWFNLCTVGPSNGEFGHIVRGGE
jgi:hypothetical protein